MEVFSVYGPPACIEFLRNIDDECFPMLTSLILYMHHLTNLYKLDNGHVDPIHRQFIAIMVCSSKKNLDAGVKALGLTYSDYPKDEIKRLLEEDFNRRLSLRPFIFQCVDMQPWAEYVSQKYFSPSCYNCVSIQKEDGQKLLAKTDQSFT